MTAAADKHAIAAHVCPSSGTQSAFNFNRDFRMPVGKIEPPLTLRMKRDLAFKLLKSRHGLSPERHKPGL